MPNVVRFLLSSVVVLILALFSSSPLAGQTPASGGKLVLSGDLTYFMGMGKPLNCVMNSRFKRGDPVGFRMTAINPETMKRDRATQLVVHVTYGGKTIELPMQDHQSERSQLTEFWVAKWIVPADAPLGVVRYMVTAKDPQGRTGEWKPFENQLSMLTIVE